MKNKLNKLRIKNKNRKKYHRNITIKRLTQIKANNKVKNIKMTMI